jgi:hypothetical protein
MTGGFMSKKTNDKIREYLAEQFDRKLDEFNKQFRCKHKFEKYGLGYKCKECGFYTGTNDELNRVIKRKK